MFRCGKTLIAIALMLAMPVAVSAQTPAAPSTSAQPVSQARHPLSF
jgi:hypothetical protein